MAGPGRVKDKPDDNSTRRQAGQGPARANQAREARQAEALRANLRKRKAQAKAKVQAEGATADAPEKAPKGK